MLNSVLVTVTGITLHMDLLVSMVVLRSAKAVPDVRSSLMALDLAAESLHVDLTQDQMLAHLTANAHLPLLMVVKSMN
jgi:hypothetical protein